MISDGFREVHPVAGNVIDLRITMVPPASIRGKVTGVVLPSGPSGGQLLCRLDYADGVSLTRSAKSTAPGQFELDDLPPGVVKLSLETKPPTAQATPSGPIELKSGQVTQLPSIALTEITWHRVSGQLLASPTISKLDGLKIRLDLMEWQPMVATDAQGQFVLPKVASGKHRLTAYLPFNLRTDRGVGHVDIEVKDGDSTACNFGWKRWPWSPADRRPVRPAAERHFAAAWWTENHSGVFTEGTKSDQDGHATLYLYPDQRQYVGAYDWSGKYRLNSKHKVLDVKPGQTTEELTVTMEPTLAGERSIRQDFRRDSLREKKMTEALTYTGLVTDKLTGKPIAGATVACAK